MEKEINKKINNKVNNKVNNKTNNKTNNKVNKININIEKKELNIEKKELNIEKKELNIGKKELNIVKEELNILKGDIIDNIIIIKNNNETEEFEKIIDTKGIYTVQLTYKYNILEIILKKKKGYVPIISFINNLNSSLKKEINKFKNEYLNKKLISKDIDRICKIIKDKCLGKINNKDNDKKNNKDYGIKRTLLKTNSLLTSFSTKSADGLPNGFTIKFQFNIENKISNLLIPYIGYNITKTKYEIKKNEYESIKIDSIFKILLYLIYEKDFKDFFEKYNLLK
jgi:hypothetical protein